jgi:hypothetical protein
MLGCGILDVADLADIEVRGLLEMFLKRAWVRPEAWPGWGTGYFITNLSM